MQDDEDDMDDFYAIAAEFKEKNAEPEKQVKEEHKVVGKAKEKPKPAPVQDDDDDDMFYELAGSFKEKSEELEKVVKEEHKVVKDKPKE